MSEIGEMLRELRIKKGLSIDDIQEITKIRSRYIQAIEEGNLDKLPGQFYAKAFIKSYAEVVDLDPKILEEYQQKIPVPDFGNVEVKPRYNSVPNSSSRIGKWLIVSLVYILIALVLLFAYIFYVSYSDDSAEDVPGNSIDQQRLDVDDNKPDDEPDQNTPPETDENDIGTGDSDQPKEEIQISKTSTTTENNRPYDVYEVIAAEGKEINIQLKFTGRVWFDIRDGGPDGRQLQTGTLDTGAETGLYKLSQHIWFNVGNSSGVDIYINDKKISVGEDRNPRYISIIRKNEQSQ